MKICVVTGTRAEYGLFSPLLDLIKTDNFFDLKIIATSMHLSPEFGCTIQEIERDGFVIEERIETLLSSDSPVGVSKSMGLTMISFAESFARLRPDLLVLLGDRFEIFAAAAVAHVSNIPIAHIHGGELTEGAIDDAFRHAITKMSALHFTTTETHKKRVIQLGEQPQTVFNVGALGIDNIRRLNLIDRSELERQLNIKFQQRNLLVTFHPATLEDDRDVTALGALLEVLGSMKDTCLIFTKANADAGGRRINERIEHFVSQRNGCYVFSSLGQLRYLSLMKQVDAVVGNSSSGIIEAPALKKGTINIGDRQKGRERASSVIDCTADRPSLEGAFAKLYSAEFQNFLKNVKNPYGNGNTGSAIINHLRQLKLPMPKSKKFYDLPPLIA